MLDFESAGEKIRNLLSPYKLLIDLVDLYMEGGVSETEFRNLCSRHKKIYAENLNNFIQFSKREDLENLNIRDTKN